MSTSTSSTLFTAVSNLSYGNFPIGPGRPADTQEFRTLPEAKAWLVSLRCGGSVSTWLPERRDFGVVLEVLPGAP